MDYLPKTQRKTHPQDRANFISQLYFLYTASLFMTGNGRDLKNSDLYDVPSALNSKKLGEELDQYFQRQLTKDRKASIFLILFKIYGLSYFLLGVSQVVLKTSLIILRPLLVTHFASFFQTERPGVYAGLYGLSIVGLVLVECWYDQWYVFKLTSLEIKVRASLSALFYRKCLRLSSLSSESVGKMITLITKDVYNLETCVRTANDTWISFVQVGILSYILVVKIGVTALILVLLLLILLPMQIPLAMKTKTLKAEMLEETDNRYQTTKDLLSDIHTIQMYAWEFFFQTKLQRLRSNEISLTYRIFLLKFILYINGILWTCVTFFPWMAIFIFFGNEVTSDVVFFMLDTHRVVGSLLTITIPFALSQIAQAVATINRIDKFLIIKEGPLVSKKSNGCTISMKNVSVAYKKESVLSDINLAFDKGLVLITGSSGSGKSFLLRTLLGECEVKKGSVVVEGSISYASQQPWLFPATVRQNVVFGEEFDEKRYTVVLEICDLVHDLRVLQNGDLTVIEDNTMLSKGQSVKLSLARALYKKSDIYLLDDPVMTLDSHLKDHILRGCTQFLRDKLVLLVMHDQDFIECPHDSVVLDNGKVVSCSYSHFETASRTPCDIKPFAVDDDESIKFADDINEESQLLPVFHPKDIYYDESKKAGEIDCKVYKKWMRAGGGVLHSLIITLFLVLLPLVTSFLEKNIHYWALNEETITNATRVNASQEIKELMNVRKNYVTVQIVLTVLLLIVTLGTSVAFLNFAKCASIKLHKVLVDALSSANLHFLDASDGTILNKMSRDLLNIDEIIPFLFYALFKMFIPMVSAMIFIVPVQRIFLVPLVILIVLLIFIKKVYLTVGRSLKRLEASSKSPVVGHLNATLAGLTTIKAQNSEQKVLDEFEDHLNLHISSSFTYVCATRAFSLAIGWTSTIFLGIVISRFLAVGSDSSSVTLAIFHTLLLVQILNIFFLDWAEIETHMIAGERLLELTQLRPQHSEGATSGEWWKPGQIKFKNVCLYDTILNNVSFVVHPKEKIGVVGRSGSGKSVLISALLRTENFVGQIFVNGADTKMLSLELLRSSISVISQDAMILKGTVKENLDPFSKHSDDEIWDVLDSVDLKKFVWDLNVDVSDTYIVRRNQKVLLCLARVILEKKEIVVFDNFLVNVEDSVKTFLCNLIQTLFANCTVLIVTHDLQVLSCCNRVMLLDDGRIVDFDTFARLTQYEGGASLKMLCRRSKGIANVEP